MIKYILLFVTTVTYALISLEFEEKEARAETSWSERRIQHKNLDELVTPWIQEKTIT